MLVSASVMHLGRALVAMAVAIGAAAVPASATTVYLERLGSFESIITLTYVASDPSSIVEYDCSSGACDQLGCRADWTICAVDGLAPGSTLTVSASSQDCYACPPPGQCTPDTFACGGTGDGTVCAQQSMPIRFAGFLPLHAKGSWLSGRCVYDYTVPSDNAVLAACWQCGPDFLGAGGTTYVGTNCDCQVRPAPPLPTASSTTSTTLPGGGGADVAALIEALLDSFLPPPLGSIIRRLILSADGSVGQKGTLRGAATSGATVVFKGKVRVRKRGPVKLPLRVTRAGRALLKRATGDGLPLTVTLSFSGHGASASGSRDYTLTP